jgi:hypothetical protein
MNPVLIVGPILTIIVVSLVATGLLSLENLIKPYPGSKKSESQ